MSRVVVTGSASGIGREVALLFLERGHEVHGIDLKEATYPFVTYTHHVADVSDADSLPVIDDVNVLINNAGTWYESSDAIGVNLLGTINCTKMYGLQPKIRSIVNVASASAHSGAEFPKYVASKGGVVAYTKWTALEVADYGATCNSISPGGVVTASNEHILKDAGLWARVMDETLLDKWASASEIAAWIYFLAVVNKSATAQDILIDNGEMAKAVFVW